MFFGTGPGSSSSLAFHLDLSPGIEDSGWVPVWLLVRGGAELLLPTFGTSFPCTLGSSFVPPTIALHTSPSMPAAAWSLHLPLHPRRR